MFGLGPWELVLIFLIVLIIFGAGKLPQLGANLGKGIKNFRESLREKDSLASKSQTKEEEESNKS